MTVLLSKPERQAQASPDIARSLDTIATILILVTTIAILYLAREILVPIAIAVLLSFVLSPLVKAMRRIGLSKRISVVVVVLSSFLVAVGFGAVLAKQISDLAADAPRYQATVATKATGLRDFAAHSPVLAKLNAMIADVSQMSPPPEQKKTDAAKPGMFPAPRSDGSKMPAPVPVELVSPAPGVLTILQTVAGTAASPLATAAFVAIFIVFILLQREDLRNRFIRLVGFADLQRTTLAMTDAASRLSRYLLAQVLLNIGFGVAVGCALAIIGVPSAVLWGIVAAIMRFIPYIGALGAAVGPIAMAAVAGAGWDMAIETTILFVALETIVGQVVEPYVYGQRTGISPIAVVASATFWTWLWGPIGLVLSTPLTVCLVVMGRHVERFAFLDVLLGDAPALSPVESFYQRMLAGDPSEVIDHADAYLREKSLLDYCSQVAMPTLLMAQADVRRGALEESRQSRIRDAMRELVEDLADDAIFETPAPTPVDAAPAALAGDAAPIDAAPVDAAPVDAEDALPVTTIDSAWRRDGAVVCVAGRTPLDEAAAFLLADLLIRQGIGAHVEPAESLMAADAPRSPDTRLVILSLLDADLKLAQARFAVRRLRRRLPGVPIVSAFWMAEEDHARTSGLCSDVRCDTCVSSLPQALKLCLERAAETPVADAA